jgi:hypothetical protein
MADITYLLEEVFVTEGVPQFTFVKPANYSDILLDIRRPGKPVVVEGQSGTGKTTCVRQVIAELQDQFPTEYLSARDPIAVTKIGEIAGNRKTGRYVIDDFHRLPEQLQSKLADIAKLSAELGADAQLPKLIIIGINQVGSSLIQLIPDIAKRTGIHRIKSGDIEHVRQLVQSGSERLRVHIPDIEKIFVETNGDFWLTQQICQSICAAAGITETQSALKTITFNVAEIRQRVVDRLQAAYHPAVKEFC